MSRAVPAEKAVELYNTLLRLPKTDELAISRIAFQLESLRRAQPGNLNARVALLKAYCLLGRVELANELANGLWHVRSGMGRNAKKTYTTAVHNLGLYEKFVEVCSEISDELESKKDSIEIELLFTSFWRLGDLQSAKSYNEIMFHNTVDFENWQAIWKMYFAELEIRGLASHFREHQRIVREETAGKQIASTAVPMQDTDSGPQVVTFIFLPEMYKDRVAREDRILNRLEQYYNKYNLEHSGYWELNPTVLLHHHAIAYADPQKGQDAA